MLEQFTVIWNSIMADECPFKDMVHGQDVASDRLRSEARIGKLEGIVESLTNSIQVISTNINSVSAQVSDLKDIFSGTITQLRENFTDQLDTVSNRLTSSSKPQWQTISAFVSIAVVLLGMSGAVVGIILSGQSDKVKMLNTEMVETSHRMFDNQYEKGKADATIASAELHLKSIDLAIQREMTLAVSSVDTKINGLDTKLQIEFNLIRKNLEDAIVSNLTDIKDLRAWRLKHTEEDAALGAKLQAKQDMINKKLSELDERQLEYHAGKLKMFEDRELNKTTAKP